MSLFFESGRKIEVKNKFPARGTKIFFLFAAQLDENFKAISMKIERKNGHMKTESNLLIADKKRFL